MIELETSWDTVVMLLMAGGVGALGGIAADLLEKQRQPRSRGAPRRLGFRASVYLGAVAAIGVLYFFPPAQETVKQVAGQAPETTTEYDLTKLVALALIVGSAGSHFLAQLQARTFALASQQQAQAATAASKSALAGVLNQAQDAVRTSVAAAASAPRVQPAVQEVADQGRAEPERVNKVVEAIAADAAASVQTALSGQVETAQKMIDAAGEPGPAGPSEGEQARKEETSKR